jgi:hypothetical protein
VAQLVKHHVAREAELRVLECAACAVAAEVGSASQVAKLERERLRLALHVDSSATSRVVLRDHHCPLTVELRASCQPIHLHGRADQGHLATDCMGVVQHWSVSVGIEPNCSHE